MRWATGFTGRIVLVALAVGLGSGLLAAPPALAVAYASPPPAAPVPTAPADGSATTANPVFRWLPVEHALEYRVEVYANASMIGATACTGMTTTNLLSCDELPPETYFWRVRAIGPSSDSDWSPVRHLVKLPRSIGTTARVAPADGAVVAYPDVGLLRWTPVAGAESYQVQVAEHPGEEAPPAHVGLVSEAATRVHVPAIGSTLWWRVRAVGIKGVERGPWTAWASYVVTWTAPTGLAPEDGATVADAGLTWQPMAGAIRYEVQVTDAAGDGFDGVPITSIDRPWLDHGAPHGATIRWRVRAVSEWAAPGPWSAARTLTVGSAAAPAPDPAPVELGPVQLIGPVDGTTGATATDHPLDWVLAPGAVRYQVMITSVGTPFWSEDPPLDPNVAPMPPLVVPKAWGGEYQWRVRAIGPGDARGPWSDTWTFATPAAGTVTLLEPAGGATVAGEELAFRWVAPPDGPIGWLETSRSPAFPEDETTVTRTWAGQPLIALRGVLRPQGTWYWRLATGRGVATARSETRTLIIEDTMPPAGHVSTSGAWSLGGGTRVGFDAADATGEIVDVALSADGEAWTSFGWPIGEVAWSLTQPPYGDGPGPRPVHVRWLDTAGNWSRPQVVTILHGVEPVDTTPPVVTTPRLGLVPYATVPADGRIPVRLRWTSDDPETAVMAHVVLRTTDGGIERVVADGLRQPWLEMTLASGHRYAFRVAASTVIGPGPLVASAERRLLAVTESDDRVGLRGTWRTRKGDAYWGGRALLATTPGAKATLRVRGREVALVASRGPSKGRAAVYVDGVRVATVDLWAPTARHRAIVWTGAWSTSAERTVVVRLVDTPGRNQLLLDGFAILR